MQVTAALMAFNLPWIIKPIYGLVSDFVPLFGFGLSARCLLSVKVDAMHWA